jgi:exo-rhamnogalacturonan lyase-like protein
MHPRHRHLAWLVLWLVGLSPIAARGEPAAAPLDPQTITLTVTEHGFVDRTNEPVTTGVPILTSQVSASWALFDGLQEIPLQTTVLPSRNLPWLLLDFQTSIAGGLSRVLTLRQRAPTVSPPQPVVITENALQITVTTGPLRTQLSKIDFNLLDDVWLDRNGNDLYESGEQVVRPSATSNLTVQQAGTGTVFTGRGVPQQMVWEYRGPMRATLRIDGAYTNGSNTLLNYTTRLTWRAGQSDVRIEHVLRNSLAAQERYVKLSSARLLMGSATATSRIQRSGSVVWSNVPATGAGIELIPPTLLVSIDYDLSANPPITRNNILVDIDANGGLVIGDLSYHGATWQADFAENLSTGEATRRAAVASDPLMALAEEARYADLGAFGQYHYSTYTDEKNAYRSWRWTWPTPNDGWSQEHNRPRVPDLDVSWSVVDAATDPESDDLWQNIMMYARVQLPFYLDRLRAWSRYTKWEWSYRTDGFAYAGAWGDYWDGPGTVPRTPIISPPLTAIDNAYIAHNIKHAKAYSDHIWNGGLLDAYYLTGDRDALEAAIDVAEQSRRNFEWQTQTNSSIGANIRSAGRALLILARTWDATGDPQWRSAADHLVSLLRQSQYYDQRGFFFGWISALGPSYTSRFAPTGKHVTPFMMTTVVEGLYRYYLDTGDAGARTQLLQIATFWRDHGLDPATGYGGDQVVVDSPQPGDVLHLTYTQWYDQRPVWPYTVASSSESMINALVIGYRLTGEGWYLVRGRLYWNQASKRKYNDPYTQHTATDTQVGRWMNSLQGWPATSLFYPDGGDLTPVSLLFYEAARADSIPPNAVLNLHRE